MEKTLVWYEVGGRIVDMYEESDGGDGGQVYSANVSYLADASAPQRYYQATVKREFFLELLRYLGSPKTSIVQSYGLDTHCQWRQAVDAPYPYIYRVELDADSKVTDITALRIGNIEFVKGPGAPAGKPSDLQQPPADRLQEREI